MDGGELEVVRFISISMHAEALFRNLSERTTVVPSSCFLWLMEGCYVSVALFLPLCVLVAAGSWDAHVGGI